VENVIYTKSCVSAQTILVRTTDITQHKQINSHHGPYTMQS